MAYNSRRQSPADVYVRFSSYTGNDKPAQAQYQNIPQQPDMVQQGLSSVPQIDMMQSQAAPPMMDNRFANAPPPNSMPHMARMAPPEMPTRVLKFQSGELYELLNNPKHHYTREGKPTKVVVKVYTDWCGPCKTLAPKFDELSIQPENCDILFVSIDGEKIGPELAQQIAVSAVPVTFTFHCGRKLNMVPGPNIDAIRAAVQELASYNK